MTGVQTCALPISLKESKSAQKAAEEELEQLRTERDLEKQELADLRQFKADTEGALQAEYDKGAQYVVDKYMRQLVWIRSNSFHQGWIGALKHCAVDPEDAAWGFHQPGPKPVDSDDEDDVVASDQLSSGHEDEVVIVNQGGTDPGAVGAVGDAQDGSDREDRSPAE